MVKLYVPTKKGLIEVENHFRIDGYGVGDRLLEGVMFDIKFKDRKVLDVTVAPEDSNYFDDLNTTKWLKEIKEYAERMLGKLTSGRDTVYLPPAMVTQYGVEQGQIFDDSIYAWANIH